MAKRQPTAQAGKKLGRYRIQRELGRGGMGVVYLAQDENLGRLVALKTTSVAGLGSGSQSRNQRRQRFIREVKALAQVSHDNVVHVYDAGEADDPELGWLLFYTMQFVDGVTLAQLVRELGALDPGAAAAVVMQVAEGLSVAHARGIVHRDVKPANIFLTKDGRALIGDFGICKIEGSTQITRRDQLIGTPNYLAPEQILGEEITPATDVFALAALFFIICTNRPLREQVDAASLLAEAGTNAPRDKVLAEKSIPTALRKTIGRALERDPARRFVDGRKFAEALADHATRIPIAPSVQAGKRPTAVPAEMTSNPFGSLSATADPDPAPTQTGDDLVGRGTSGVEDVAQALLNEVEQSGQHKKSKPKPAALPVAQAESTVMFNLRQMEQDNATLTPAPAPTAPVSADLPVARSEPTVMFNLRNTQPRATPIVDDDAPSPLAEDTPGALVDEAWGEDQTSQIPAFDDVTGQAAPMAHSDEHPVAPGPVAKAPPPAPTQKPPKPKKVRPPRTGPSLAERLRDNWLYLAVPGVAVVAALVVALFASLLVGDREPPIEVPAVRLDHILADGPKPAMCDRPAPDEATAARAQKLVEQAGEAAAQKRTATALTHVKAALDLDPQNAEALFWFGRLVGTDPARQSEAVVAFRCVWLLSPDSDAGRAAKDALGRLVRLENTP